MKKILLLSSILLLSAVWAVAQYDSQSSGSQSSSSDMSKTTIQGCLSGSAGNYTLTDQSGTAYQLTGDTAKLSKHVGHEIQITGSSSTSSASNNPSNPSGAMSGSAEAQPTFNVTSFKHVSSKCSTGAGGGEMQH